MKLLSALPFAKFSWDSGGLNDLDAMRTDPVARSHLSVHLFNTTIQSSITVLLVHVMVTSSTLIPQPDTIILYLGRVLLKDLQTNHLQQSHDQVKTNSFKTVKPHGEMKRLVG